MNLWYTRIINSNILNILHVIYFIIGFPIFNTVEIYLNIIIHKNCENKE